MAIINVVIPSGSQDFNLQSLTQTFTLAIPTGTASFNIIAQTSSFCNQTLSASYASAVSNITSSVFGTSSWTSNVVGGIGTTLFTGSTVPITSSVSLVSISSSYATFAQTFPAVLVTGSTYQVTSSWATTAVTARSLTGQLTGSNPSYAPGLMFYDTGSFSFRCFNENPADFINIGREVQVRVFNSSSNFISNGSAVYLSGSFTGSSVAPTIPTANAWLAIADGTGTKYNVAGVATVDIQTGSFGYICTIGRVDGIANFNFPNGSTLYLSPITSGSYTTTIPTSSFEKTVVGYCVLSGSAGGIMIVDINPNSNNSQSSSLAISSSNALSASNGARAWGFLRYDGTTLTTNTYGCSVLRIGLGSFGVTLSPVFPSTLYAVTMNASSASRLTPSNTTASVGFPFNQATTGFTMSMAQGGNLGLRADFTTASFSVFSN
jgi:hypothetical protein